VKCSSVQEILNAKSVDDLFTNDLIICRGEYRSYLKKFHPDYHNGEKLYQDATTKIVQLYEKATELISKGDWEEYNVVRFSKPNGKTLVVNYLKEYPFELGIMYLCNNHVVFAVDNKHKKYALNYISNYHDFVKSPELLSRLGYALPKVQQNFQSKEKYIIIIDRLNKCVPLCEVLANFGGTIPAVNEAWITTRLMDLCCYLSCTGKVHNGICMENLFVDIEKHGVMLYGGWWYTRPQGEKLIGICADVYNNMPLSARTSKTATTQTDIECVKALTIQLLGAKSRVYDNSIPKAILEWTKSPSNIDVISQYSDWEKALNKAFKKRKFVKINPDKAKINI